jgi:hypothetical protein
MPRRTVLRYSVQVGHTQEVVKKKFGLVDIHPRYADFAMEINV